MSREIQDGSWPQWVLPTIFADHFRRFPVDVTKVSHTAPLRPHVIWQHHQWAWLVAVTSFLATFRSEYEYVYEYEFSVLSTRCRFKGRNFSKCACSDLKLVLVVVLVLRSEGRSYPREGYTKWLITSVGKQELQCLELAPPPVVGAPLYPGSDTAHLLSNSWW